jgi:hypothetical protein
MRTERWRSPMPGLRLVGEEENGPVSTNFGPVRAGLTTTHRTQLQQLSELLNSLESDLIILQSKLCEAYATCMYVSARLAKLSPIITDTTITDIE